MNHLHHGWFDTQRIACRGTECKMMGKRLISDAQESVGGVKLLNSEKKQHFYRSPHGDAERMMDGIFVGHHERTGASLFLSERGLLRGTRVQRKTADQQWDNEFIRKCRGVPWMLIGEEPEVRPPPVPAVMMPLPEAILRTPQQRRRYILKQDVARYGPTPECEACTTLAAGAQRVTKPHSDECRARMEELMQRDEDALVQQRLHTHRLRRGSTVSEDERRNPDVEMNGSGLPSGSGGEASRGEGARESTRTETEAARSSGETSQPGSGEPMQTAPEDAETRRGLKRSAELPIDDLRSEVRGRGLHLDDDDVPIVTPTEQQTERPADAAEAHMSVGKMELISNAAAKMMNAAVKCELTGAGVWTLAKTAIELFGASVSRFADKSTSYGIDSTLIIDLTARRDDGRFWDLGTREDRKRLDHLQQEHQTELLIGSAPCISFRTLLYPSGTKTQTDRVQDQERQYTRACIEAYKRQLIMGRHFLHEHPVHASSWCMPEMRELMNDGRVHLVQGPMCHWRLSSTGDGDEQGFVRGKTRWATSSSRLAALLARKHAGENRRVR